jgi:hypothetical protein
MSDTPPNPGSEAKHSPLPWEYLDTGCGDGRIEDLNGELVADGLWREDADFILRAVNATQTDAPRCCKHLLSPCPNATRTDESQKCVDHDWYVSERNPLAVACINCGAHKTVIRKPKADNAELREKIADVLDDYRLDDELFVHEATDRILALVRGGG